VSEWPSDLYEFPPDHAWRKTYVSVRGHVRSIPRYKTYLGTDSRNHLLPEYGGDEITDNGTAYIMQDIGAFKSPVDGSYITSRSHLREHNTRNGVVQSGDAPVPKRQADRDVHRAISGRDIADSIKMLGGH